MGIDDIVTRLREGCSWHHDCDDDRNAAADEIERLRTELADWQRTVRALEAELSSYRGRY